MAEDCPCCTKVAGDAPANIVNVADEVVAGIEPNVQGRGARTSDK